ncbi:MAG: hypothetical protein ACR2GN_01385 [Bacteroidia bacterium]
MNNRILSSLMVSVISVVLTYFLSSFFYGFQFSPIYLAGMFLFIFIAWYLLYPKLMDGREQ